MSKRNYISIDDLSQYVPGIDVSDTDAIQNYINLAEDAIDFYVGSQERFNKEEVFGVASGEYTAPSSTNPHALSFLDLADVPDSYTGSGEYYLKVKATEDGLEFVAVGGSGAPADSHYITTQAETGLSAEFSLGSLTTGLLKHTVSAGVSTPATAVAGTDYEVPLTFSSSLSRSTNTVTLDGDSATPGNTKYYGTNSSGVKGFYDIPSGYSDEQAQDAVAAMLTAGTNITLTYNDAANTLTIDATGGSSYTDENAQDAVATMIQNGTGISWSYNDGSNTLTPTVSLSPFSTTNLSEGTNLYYTDERVDDRVASLIVAGTGISATYNDGANTLTIANTLTGYSDEAVDDRVAALIQNGTGLTWTYSDASNTLTGNVSLSPFSTTNLSEGTNLYYTQARFDTAFAAKSTTNLSEGTNLYFTNERVDDRVAALIVAGTGITSTYDDTANTLTIASTVSAYTDEQAQDAIGAMIDTSLVYVDGTPLLTRAALTGDVTASQGSNSTTIANDAVTYAKMQNVSATSRVLGRISSGAGDVEELTAANLATIANSTFDHGTLAGLSDDDHTQYALLAGRSGGQTLKGGTASGDDLTLQSTSNATKGSLFFGAAQVSRFQETAETFFVGDSATDPGDGTPGATSTTFAYVTKRDGAYSGQYSRLIQSADGQEAFGTYNLINSGAGTISQSSASNKRLSWGTQNELYLSSVGGATAWTEGIGVLNYIVPSGDYARAYATETTLISSQDHGQNFLNHGVITLAGTDNTSVGYHMDATTVAAKTNTLLGNYFLLKPQSATDTVAGFYMDATGSATINNPSSTMDAIYINWEIPGTDTSNKKHSINVLQTTTNAGKAFFGDSVKFASTGITTSGWIQQETVMSLASHDFGGGFQIADKVSAVSNGMLNAGGGDALVARYSDVYGHSTDDGNSVIFDNWSQYTANSSPALNASTVVAGGWSYAMLGFNQDLSFTIFNLSGGAGQNIQMSAPDAGGGNTNGGNISLFAGAGSGSGNSGGISLSVKGASNGISFSDHSGGSPTPQFQYNLTTGMQAVVNGKQIGMGRVTAPAQVTGAATTTLTVGTDDAQQRWDFAAGSGSYTYNIELAKTSVIEGCQFEFYINKAASSNPTIVIKSGTAGSTLVSLNNGNAENWYMKFVYDGSDWVKQIAVKNDL